MDNEGERAAAAGPADVFRPRPGEGAAPIGRADLCWALGAILGIALFAAAYIQLSPLLEAISNLRDEGEVGRILEAASSARAAAAATGPGDSSPEFSSIRREAAFRRVREEVRTAFEANRRQLEPILERPEPSFTAGLRRLSLWSTLKVEWARSLARHGLAIADYRELSVREPDLIDRLLLTR